jgi:predicted metal-dependent phosphoesterase TrpH
VPQAGEDAFAPRARRFFADLHVHSSASFDSLASPRSLVRAAARQGLTHLAITDHDRIDGALEARRIAATEAPGVTVIVGEEIRTTDGDLIGLFLDRAVAPGLTPEAAIAEIRAQRGLVGIPHPFDRFRGSLLDGEGLDRLLTSVDWLEAHNARVAFGNGNVRAAEVAAIHGVPGIAVSDAHSSLEVGVAYTAFDADPSTPDGLLAALQSAEIVPGRASFYVRLLTPVAKLVQRARGNGRISAASGPRVSVGP